MRWLWGPSPFTFPRSPSLCVCVCSSCHLGLKSRVPPVRGDFLLLMVLSHLKTALPEFTFVAFTNLMVLPSARGKRSYHSIEGRCLNSSSFDLLQSKELKMYD